MKPNPGGILKGNAIVDRDKEVKTIWRALQNQSVVLISERRVGKTSILRKMEENPQDEWNPVLYWVEGKESPAEFVEGLYEEILRKELLKDKFYKLKKFYSKYAGGNEIGSWKLPQIISNWKPLLESLIEDIVDSDKKIVLMFDELPLMLAKFIKTEGIGALGAIVFLDTLRALRNKYEASGKITFVFCGSIGIHLIIKDLKSNHGYNSDPINNMKIISVSSMDAEGAIDLCHQLATNDGNPLELENDILDYICKRTDGLPFYIQHIFGYILDAGERVVNKKIVDLAIEYFLNDPNDEGFFRHYLDRIKTYYDSSNQKISLAILDRICKTDGFWLEEDIIDLVKTPLEIEDEVIRETLSLLWNDHYLVREVKNNKRTYKFRYSILQSWWKLNRG